jgi:N-acetyl-anhydromuramoyl-L-alanine amidase
LRVSAHFLVARDGRLSQFVSADERAWHAGISAWRGRAACNDFSLGIELEGSESEPFAEIQYATLAPLLAALAERYPSLSSGRLVGHSDIAPGRKRDPGPHFDWTRARLSLPA